MKKAKRKKWLIPGIVFAALLLVIFFAANTILEKLVRDEIHKQLNKAPKNLYSINSDDFDLNIFTGSFTLTNLTISPTDSAFIYFQNNQLKSLLTFSAEKFRVKSLNILDLLQKKQISIHRMTGSSVYLSFTRNSEYHSVKEKHQRAFNDLFTDYFQKAQITKFDLDDVTLKLFDKKNSEIPYFELDSLKLHCKDLMVDTFTLKQTVPVYFDEFNLTLGKMFFKTSEYYNLSTSGIAISLADSSLTFTGFGFKPRYSREAFNQKVSYNQDWFNITVNEIRCNHFYLDEFDSLGLFHFSSIEIGGPQIEIYRDKTLPDAPFKYKPLLAGLIRKIPQDMRIDTVRIAGEKLLYEEKIGEDALPGQVFFTPFFMSIYNLTNHDASLTGNSIMNVDFSGNLMGKSLLNANIDIHLTRPDDYFEINGNLESLDARELNRMVENLAFVSIESGKIQNASFRFTANDDRSDGKFFLFYDDLKVNMLNENKLDKNSKLKSFIANNLIRNKNLQTDRKYIVGNISFDRRKDKALPNYLWNSVKSGIIPIVAPVASKDEKEKVKKSHRNKK